MRSLFLFALMGAGPAFAWPAADEWTGLSLPSDEPFGDLQVADFDGLDLDGTASDVIRVAADEDYLYLSQQLGADPTIGGQLAGGAAWVFLLDLDPNPAGGDAAFDVEFTISSGETTAATNPDETPGLRPSNRPFVAPDGQAGWGSLASGDVRIQSQGANGFTLELRVLRTEVQQALGVDAQTSFRVAAASGDGRITDRFDVAGCDDSVDTCDALSPVLTETFTIDLDGDGLTALQEEALGTSPDDADSDDDGLTDGEEAGDVDVDGISAALLCDTDRDGVLDGTEAGLTAAGDDTDTDAGCFVPDADDTTMTDPLSRDTDQGGLSDGEEDRNGDGAVDEDCWETDPLLASDDVDTDEDGVPDVLETRAADGEIDDVDSDGDGVADAVEGLADPDGDCIPAFVDSDSDGDGRLDRDEGGDDPDNDGIPSNLDTDADGNGVLDADEPDGDQDCDGIDNWLDVNDVDNLCDDPVIDTGIDTDDPLVDPNRDGYFAGGGCSAVGGGASWGLGLLALLGAAIRRRRTVAVLAASTGVASAQQVDGQRFRPSVDPGVLFGVEDGVVDDNGTPTVSAVANVVDDPVVYRYSDGDDEQRLLGTAVSLNLMGAYHLGRFRVGADLPVHAFASGDAVDGPAILGDLRLSSEFQLLRQDDAPLAVGLIGDLSLPTGAGRRFLGAARTRVTLGGAASRTFGPVMVGSHLALRTGTATSVGSLKVAPAMVWAIGAGVRDGRVGVSLEADGEYWLANGGEPGRRPAEWRAVATVSPIPALDVRLGGGTALSQGLGAPDLRLFLGASMRLGPMASDTVAPVIVEPTPEPQATEGTVEVRVLAPSGLPVSGAVVRVGPERALTDADGTASVSVDPGEWDAIVEADAYRWQLPGIEVAAGERVVLVAALRPEQVEIDMVERRIYTTQTIFFELDSDVLTSQSTTVLAVLADALRDHPEVARIRIEGHTDAQGNDEYNRELSDRRAASVRDYLVAVGISPERLESVGYGEQRLLQTGDLDEVHAVNRRVEFHIVEVSSE